jgi:transposase
MGMARATREDWAKRVERWQDSGLTAKEFAAELDVAPSSLTFWKWKLRQSTSSAAKSRAPRAHGTNKRDESSMSFVRLVPTTPPAHGDLLEVVCASGVIVRVPHDFDEPTLLRLVRVLGGR